MTAIGYVKGLVLAFIAPLVLTASCTRPAQPAAPRTNTPGPVRAQAPTTLRVGLYPYVPRADQVQHAVKDAWAARHPSVALEFVSEWDGGYDADPAVLKLDVFVFDAVYLGDWIDQNVLAPVPRAAVPNPTDLLPYVQDGARTPSGDYWGIPMYGCASILFYRCGDKTLGNASTLTEVTDALTDCSYTSKVPPDKRGLMIDMAGGTTSACQYINAAESRSGMWPPDLSAPLDPAVIGQLRTILVDASYYNATGEFPSYGRGASFGQGFGRATVGYTESMSAMGSLDGVQFKVMPFGDDKTAPALFYADIAGIWSGSQHQALAQELVALMTDTVVMVAATGPTQDKGPQYLMPARNSVFDALETAAPMYGRMQALVADANPVLFNLGVGGRAWVESNKNQIKTGVRADYTCGCDQNAPSYLTQSTAATMCPGICVSHGGWNHQWRNENAAKTGVCGCNTCP